MEKLKKPYTAPTAELLLLAPVEAVAATTETAQENQWAMNKWGQKALNSASITGSNFSMWGEDRRITTTTK